MGWIFSPRSPRRIPVELAGRLIREIRRADPAIRHVGVLADNSVPEIHRMLRSLPPLDFLQLVEGPGFIASLEKARGPESSYQSSGAGARPGPRIPAIWPVVRVREPVTDTALTARYGDRFLWLMDSYVPGQAGGTGRRFAPGLVSELRRPFLVAGGLNDENVREALLASGAAGADVSSGIEFPGRPGRKDPGRLRRFVHAIRTLDAGGR